MFIKPTNHDYKSRAIMESENSNTKRIDLNIGLSKLYDTLHVRFVAVMGVPFVRYNRRM